MQFVPEDGLYVYFRYDEQKTVMVMINTSDQSARVDTARFAERLNGFGSAVDVVTGKLVERLDALEVPPHAPLVLELKR